MVAYYRRTVAEYFPDVTDNDKDFFIVKGNFLDDFYSADDEERRRMVSTPIPAELVADHTLKYAVYFSAMIEHLCWHHGLECPKWVTDGRYRLSHPWFLYDNWRFRAWQLVMTPPSFVSRNIFTGDQPVARV